MDARARDLEPTPEFAVALRRLAPPAPAVPADVDARLLAAARTPRRRVPPVLRFALPLAAAAAVVLWLWPRAVPGDLDRDGRVDVVDAYLLAVRVEHGEAGRDFDLNGDGGVDRRDVEHVAALAVRVR